jgi:hypothetical protein
MIENDKSINDIKALKALLRDIEDMLLKTDAVDEDQMAKLRELRQQCEFELALYVGAKEKGDSTGK